MNRGLCIFSAFVISFFLIIGCGGNIKQTIAPAKTDNVKYIPTKNPVRIEGIKKVCIFPLADYSHQQSFLETEEWGGNIKIMEEITDQIISHGLSVVVQEDVNTLLADYEVIKPIRKKYLLYGTAGEEAIENEEPGTPEYEMKKVEHSPEIKEELMNIIRRNKEKEGREKEDRSHPDSSVLQGTTVGLNKEMVMEIGKQLGVDLIIRGRIIEFGYKDTSTFSPLYRGAIPVLLDSVKNMVFGADYYGYEDDLEALEYMMVGSGMGYAIGHQIIKRSTSTHTELQGLLITREKKVTDVDHDAQGGLGAAAGGVSGLIASQHPKTAKRSSVLQIRIYAQDARTGEVLWSNRTEVEYTPWSNFSYGDIHPKVMFDEVIKHGVKSLMDNFFNEAERVLPKEAKS
jgi:hypothetical protein